MGSCGVLWDPHGVQRDPMVSDGILRGLLVFYGLGKPYRAVIGPQWGRLTSWAKCLTPKVPSAARGLRKCGEAEWRSYSLWAHPISLPIGTCGGVMGSLWGRRGGNGVSGGQWGLMGVNGSQWKAMGGNRSQWSLMGVNGSQ